MGTGWPDGCEVLLFDLDGVLVDSRLPIVHCIKLALERLGVSPPSDQELFGYIGPPLSLTFSALLIERGLGSHLAATALEHYRLAYAVKSLEDTVVFPGIAPMLDKLASHFNLSVVTTKPTVYAMPILERLDLRKYVVDVFGTSLELEDEPKAITLARALASSQFLRPEHPGRAAMIGDRRFDVEAGRACGIATVGVTWGIGNREELSQADRLVPTPSALARLLIGEEAG